MSKFCGGCGAQRSRLDQAFCQKCGTPFDSAAPVSAPVPAPVSPRPSTPPGVGTAPEYAVPGGLPRQGGVGGRAGRVVGAGLLVLALVGGGLVGWQVFGPKGGADSPEEAVRQFLDAGVNQDVVGALDMVNPAEVEGLDTLVAAARERLADEELTSTSGDLTDALTVTLEDLEFDTDELGDSGARVLLRGGSYTVTFDPDELPDRLAFAADDYPDGGTWRGNLLDDLGQELPDANWGNDRPDPFVATVKIDGRWYVTALGTFVDVFVGVPTDTDFREEGIRQPDYNTIDDDVDPIVAEEPEDVLDNLVDAAGDEDVAQLLANFPADEVAALRPWATTVEDIFADEGLTFDVSLEGVDTSVDELGGNLVRLTIEEGSVFGAYQNSDGDYRDGSAGVDGRCVSASDSSGEDSFCIEGDIAAKTGIDSYYLILREVDGGYQIDPIATAIDYASTVVESAPSGLVEDALEAIEADL